MTKIIQLIALIVAASCTIWGAPVLTLYPDNNLFPPNPPVLEGNGEVVGIGFDLQNDNSGYIVIDSVDLTTDPSPTGTVTDWTDLLSGNLSDAIAPGADLSQTWIAGTQGLGEFNFVSSPVGFTGPLVTIELTYDLYGTDPFTDSNAVDLDSGLTIDTQVQFDETDPGVAAAPEPAMGGLIMGCLAWMWRVRRRIV